MTTQAALSGAVVLAVLLGGTVLRSRFPKVPLWSVMMLCTAVTLLADLVPVEEAMTLVDLDVITLLIGMFALVGMADRSGLLDFVAYYFLSVLRTTRALVMGSSLLFGMMSAFFVNDTVALMGPPIAVTIGRALGGSYEFAFLLLCFSITIGSAMTPIGNPQNVLIAVQSGMRAPFPEFLLKLAVPTLLSLTITSLLMMRLYKLPDVRSQLTVSPWEAVRSKRELVLAAFGGGAAVTALMVNDINAALGLPHITTRGLIPFTAAAALLAFTESPREVLARVDFGTILFFIGMFISIEGIWRSGVLQPVLSTLLLDDPVGPLGMVSLTVLSLVMSQLISNVPYTKLAIEQLKGLGVTGAETDVWLTLASAATLAGNLTILGAASNVIVLEVLESRYGATISYLRFMKVGALVTAVTMPLFLLFLVVM
ncbi:MAG: SLC13 family permease [Thaumarchaeota archaeon]|nr:SLC13 family permease [Candidatus Calditenuaceae archaeon]MDW8042193.1 SLC13 family permease [Nitrososphaerota archaeon]